VSGRDDVAFVVNPASANGSTGRRWPEMARRAAAAGLHGETFVSEAPGDVAAKTQLAVSNGARLVVAVGGDGTISEAVNGFLRAGTEDAELAILPRGTGADYVRTFRIPRRLDDAIAVALNGATRRVDVGVARYTGPDGQPAASYFANFAGAGISGAIARRANESSKALGGRASFIIATVVVFLGWRSAEIAIDVDGERREGRMFEVLATNGEYAAGGMWVTPGAAPDDGRLDVLLIGDVTKADFVATFPKIYRGTHLSHPKIERLRGRVVRVETEMPLPIALDGEQPGTTPAIFELVPQALRLRVPA
jgi:YegS/Rv2252/BmrU family lipid kinase